MTVQLSIDVRKAHHPGSHWDNWWRGHPWYIVRVIGWKVDTGKDCARHTVIAEYRGEALSIREEENVVEVYDKGILVGHIENVGRISWTKRGKPMDVRAEDTRIIVSHTARTSWGKRR